MISARDAAGWGHEITAATAGPLASDRAARADGKATDPLSLAAMVVSIPPAALAVLDLGDRIRKRRRARELIDQAQQLADRQVTVYVISAGHVVDLRTLTPDQVLDLQDAGDPVS